MHWFFDPSLSNSSSSLAADEAKHARSLRLQVGEKITVTNGRGLVVSATMNSEVTYAIEKLEEQPAPRRRFHLVQALAKSDRDEMALQAACELGLATVTPWAADRSIVRWDGKEARNADRWQQIALSAMKQSQQPWLTEVMPLAKTKQLSPLGLGLVLDPRAEATLADVDLSSSDVMLVVGPEGGISESELADLRLRGFKPVRLGPSVLRTSTAGPAALAALQFASGYWS